MATRTPFDDEMAALNVKLAGTSLFAGRRAAREEGRAAATEVAGLAAPAAADRIAYKAKAEGKGFGALSGASAVGGAVDLAAAPARLDALADDELPDELAKLAPEARKAAVEKAAKDRAAIEAQLTKLAQQRDAWLAKHAAEKKDSFDEQVFATVKARAAKAGVAY